MSDEIRLVVLVTLSLASLVGIRLTFARSLRENDREHFELGSGRTFDTFTTDFGGWLFPIVVLVAAVDGLTLETLGMPDRVQDLMLILFIGSAGLLLWADLLLARHFRSLDITNPTLIRSGPFRIVRHPRYASWLALLASFSLTNNSGLGLAGAVAFGFVVARRVRIEEKFLIEMYGDRYEDYASGTSRILPFLW